VITKTSALPANPHNHNTIRQTARTERLQDTGRLKTGLFKPVQTEPLRNGGIHSPDPVDSNIFLYFGIQHFCLTEQTKNTAGAYHHDERPGKRAVGLSPEFSHEETCRYPFFLLEADANEWIKEPGGDALFPKSHAAA
jgi:hypothetical protein